MTAKDATDMALLYAIADRIIPPDHDPGALESGAAAYLIKRLLNECASDAFAVSTGVARVQAMARAVHNTDFADLTAILQDTILQRFSVEIWFIRLAELVSEGYYADAENGGNARNKSWQMIGYKPRLPKKTSPRTDFSRYTEEQPIDGLFDAIIIGAGAGGGIAACVLAEAGKRVLLLERGDAYSYEVSGRRDHLRNHRLSQYGHNTGPEIDVNPRIFVDCAGHEHVLYPHERGYHSNAAGPGSGTAVYGGQAWRFHPDDFRMASRYGVPAGSSLVDWPFSYDDLAPFYARAEIEIGVAGGQGHPSPRTSDYPMPPVPGYKASSLLEEGARSLGLNTFTPPLLLNTVPRQGRAACVECGSCVGFACPSNAKNGTQNTVIPRALATGLCTFVLRATAERIETDASGKVSGVVWRQGLSAGAPRRKAFARSVVLAGGAVETARLLLLSANEKHPKGFGNKHDQVGRHFQGHVYPTAFGLFNQVVYNPHGPGVTIASCDYNHGNKGIVGGGMLADDFIMLPVIFWRTALPPDMPRWGMAAKTFMREKYRRVLMVRGPVQEIPNPEARVMLDAHVKDHFGLPVARMSGTTHPETIRTATFMLGKAEAWLKAAGAQRIWSDIPLPRLSGGQHQAGTCRMGSDPCTSVTDLHGKVWGFENLFVADASLHPTNGGFNPVLTVMALAYRTAEHIAGNL